MTNKCLPCVPDGSPEVASPAADHADHSRRNRDREEYTGWEHSRALNLTPSPTAELDKSVRSRVATLGAGHEFQRQPRLAGRQPSTRGGVPRVMTRRSAVVVRGSCEAEARG